MCSIYQLKLSIVTSSPSTALQEGVRDNAVTSELCSSRVPRMEGVHLTHTQARNLKFIIHPAAVVVGAFIFSDGGEVPIYPMVLKNSVKQVCLGVTLHFTPK
jgi:hypothetical protein